MKIQRNNVLVPVADSAFSLQVVPFITRLFEPQKTHVILLRVAPEPELVELGNAGDPELTIYPDQEEAALEENFHEEMLASLTDLESAGFQVSTFMRFGNPVDKIQEYLEENKVDLVAMVTHGRSGLERMWFGSVAEQVMHHTHVPVLLFRSIDKVPVRTEEPMLEIAVPTFLPFGGYMGIGLEPSEEAWRKPIN